MLTIGPGGLLTLTALSVVANALPVSKSNSKHTSKYLSGCADPIDDSCDHSQCKLEGCVLSSPSNTVHWKPDPCTTCHCDNDGTKKCHTETCKPVRCYGYAKVRPVGKCCEECDFRVPKAECRLVAVGSRRAWYKWSSFSSCTRVALHDCDKHFSYALGKWYRCDGERGLANLSSNRGCEWRIGQYYDIVKCTRTEITDDGDKSIIPDDYDPDPLCHPLPPES